MGKNKLLLELGGRSVLQASLAALRASRVEEILVVLAPGSQVCQSLAQGERTRVLENPSPLRGRTSTIQVGLRNVSPGCEAVLIALADMPCVRASTFDQVLGIACTSPTGIAVACHKGKRGHPVAFRAQFIPAILSLGEDEPLRELTRGPRVDVETDDPGVLLDLDTWSEYQALRATWRDGAP